MVLLLHLLLHLLLLHHRVLVSAAAIPVALAPLPPRQRVSRDSQGHNAAHSCHWGWCAAPLRSQARGAASLARAATAIRLTPFPVSLSAHPQVTDISLEDYIAVKPKYAVYVPHTAGRYQKRRFRKAACPIVER